MKALLYLYPIKEYVDYSISNESFYMKDCQKKDYLVKCGKINDLIDEHFRQKNYKIIYAHFTDSIKKGSGASFSDLIILRETDLLMDVGIKFEKIKNKVYPDETALIKKLLPLEKLAVSGFHCQDCASRFHQAALRLKIDSVLEKSLTEQYFYLSKVGFNFKSSLEKY